MNLYWSLADLVVATLVFRFSFGSSMFSILQLIFVYGDMIFLKLTIFFLGGICTMQNSKVTAFEDIAKPKSGVKCKWPLRGNVLSFQDHCI